MKISGSFILMFAMVFSCSKEKDEEQPTINGLVSFYTFQGHTNDVFGDNHGEGYYIGYDTIDNKDEHLVLKLNGMNSFVMLADSFDYQNRTISLWFNVKEAPIDLGIIYASDNPGLNYGMTILSTKQINAQAVLIYNISNQLDTIEIELNTWYNATLVSEGMNYVYYLNGTKINSGSFDNYISSYNGIHSAIIGCNRTIETRFFNGMVDNLRVYNRKLSDKEIKVIYNVEEEGY